MRTPSSLLVRLQPGRPGGLGEFVRLYTPLLYYWSRQLGLRGPDTDDLVQDVFLHLVRKLPDFTYYRQQFPRLAADGLAQPLACVGSGPLFPRRQPPAWKNCPVRRRETPWRRQTTATTWWEEPCV